MGPVDYEKYKFKLRSLPNSKTFTRYGDAFMYYIAVLGVYNLITICLFVDGFKLQFPALFIIALPVLFVHVYMSIEREYKNVNREVLKEAVIYIRLNQLQSLKEKVELNPEILNEKFDKKSLLYWARHHKNIQAHSYLIGELKRLKRL
jgi:hypothetical protein